MIYRLLFLILFVNIVGSLRCKKSSVDSCLYNWTCLYEIEECNSSSIETNVRGGIFCTTIIQKLDDGILIGNMGCMYDQETSKQCTHQNRCQMTFTNKDQEFSHCCCDQDLCNFNFTLPIVQSSFSVAIDQNNRCEGLICKWSLFVILGIVFFGLLFILIILYLINRQKFREKFFGLSDFCGNCHSSIPKGSSPKSTEKEKEVFLRNEISFSDLHFQGDLIKRGRFSSIYRILYEDEERACKILIDPNESGGEAKKLFEKEKEIYSLPMMSHRNILKYYGYSQSNEKYCLITELSINGSLRDVLEKRLIRDNEELDFICRSISKGLEYLHRDFRRRDSNEGRRPIAHRDLKSENILYLNENELVICDFAMSIELEQNVIYPNVQQQIGTPRYMSPEILAGTIGCDPYSLLRCDVYALGLIFWEVLSRCATEDGDLVYQMPYEEQLREKNCSRNPGVNDMLEILNSKHFSTRPIMKDSWRNSKKDSLNQLIKTMEECWDENPDSRITSASAASRLTKV